MTREKSIRLRWLSDKKSGEFHITPVITYSWTEHDRNTAKAIAFEWGWWAVYVGYYVIWKDNEYKDR